MSFSRPIEKRCAKPCHRDLLRTAIDNTLARKPKNFDGLLYKANAELLLRMDEPEQERSGARQQEKTAPQGA